MRNIKYALIFNLIFSTLLISCAHKKRPIIIAHRSASGYLPEHTLESTVLAHTFDIDFIEPDLVLTKDNHLILMHDIYLDTTTNVKERYPKRSRKDGRYYAIDFKLYEIKKLKVFERINRKTNKAYFPNRFPVNSSHFQVPTFFEFVSLIEGLNITRKKNVGIYPEIKHPDFHLKNGKDITKIFMKSLNKLGLNTKDSNIIIQCFDPQTLKRLRSEFKTPLRLVQLIADNSWNEADIDFDLLLTDKGLQEISTYADGIGPWINQLIKINNNKDGHRLTKVVSMAHKYKLFVHPYTHRVEKIPKYIKNENKFLNILFKDLKIDGIFSDYSDRIANFLN